MELYLFHIFKILDSTLESFQRFSTMIIYKGRRHAKSLSKTQATIYPS